MHFYNTTIVLSLLANSSLGAPAKPLTALPRRSMQSVSINTPLNGISSTAMLHLVHDANYMINANGLVESKVQTSADPVTFEISDRLLKLPFQLPFGLSDLLKTTYTATFENQVDGLLTKSTAGGGLLTLTGTWTVTDSALQESVLLDGNILAVLVARPFVEIAHADMHRKMLADAANGGG